MSTTDTHPQDRHAIEESLELGGLYKAAREASQDTPTGKAYELNPYDVSSLSDNYNLRGDTHQGSTKGMSYEALRALARVPIVSAIIQTRVNQVAEFCTPQPDRYSPGFIITRTDTSDETTDKERELIGALQTWLMGCGNKDITGGRTFESFVRAITRDSLTLDQACFEVIHNEGRPVAFKPVDAATIRRAALSPGERATGRRDPSSAAYVQVIDHRIVASFKGSEMAFGVRRARTELGVSGYGYPELEEAAETIVDMVRSKNYNSANFTSGLHLSGILAIKSKMSPQLFRAFRREFYSSLQGPNGSKKTPIIQLDPESKEEVSSVSLSNSNRDMEFSAWLNFLIKEVCALYQIDPAELGYMFGNEGQSSSLNQNGPSERILHSREKGLRPLLRSVESWINSHILEPLAPGFALRFVGLANDTEQRRIDATSKKVKTFMTINEARSAFDLAPLEGGDIILDQTYVTATMGRDGAEGQIGINDTAPPGEEGGSLLNDLFGKSTAGEHIDIELDF